MHPQQLENLGIIRAVVGYLGEREQYAWWQSSFFSAQSRAFLAPVFGRTQLLAQCTGVTRAARLIHDERIGVGQVYHLFRLPEDLEQAIQRAIQEPAVARRIGTLTESKDAALEYLQTMARSAVGEGVGPTRIGDAKELRDLRRWRAVASQYTQAFGHGSQVYPYFADRP